MIFGFKKREMVQPEDALEGRDAPPFDIPDSHAVLNTPIQPPFPEGSETAIFGLGCFWGPERVFWNIDGVYTTAAGYAGGYTPNPTYGEVCTGKTGHAEAVMVVFDPDKVTYRDLLKVYWESHDPTQGMRQGGDHGSQYRSIILYANDEQRATAEESKAIYQKALRNAGYGDIATEIRPLDEFYYAEDYHQQYLHKIPNGYCGSGGTGVSCSIGLGVEV